MEATSSERKVISVADSIQNSLTKSMLTLHALSGCDTVPQISGIGKKKALSALVKETLSDSNLVA